MKAVQDERDLVRGTKSRASQTRSSSERFALMFSTTLGFFYFLFVFVSREILGIKSIQEAESGQEEYEKGI